VIVTVIAMRIMQPTVHEVIDVVAMRYRLMSAGSSMRVRTAYLRRAVHGICGIDCNNMFVDMVLVHMVEMTIMKVIYMAVMPNCSVPAARAVLMGVVGMTLLNASSHDFLCSL
jgi:methionine synthase I (cobalamin-dependent)